MINFHLNGDIVRCPDISAIQYRLKEYRDNNFICQFGIKEQFCNVWTSFQDLNPCSRLNKKCYLCNHYALKTDAEGKIIKVYSCPSAQERYLNSLKPKNFNIDNSTYRKLASAAHYLVKTSEYKTLFVTLTFPHFKLEPNEKQINEAFSKFVENIRKNYNCSGYVAVRERGDVNNRYHFHIILSMPYISFTTLNNSWCAAISDISEASVCALRTRKNKIFIKNPRYAVRYACKYFAKSRGVVSSSRIVFISNNLIKKPVRMDTESDDRAYYNLYDILKPYKSITEYKTSEYSTNFRIHDHKEFDHFCENVLYYLFKLPDKNKVLKVPGITDS